jgi:hypothetical protein
METKAINFVDLLVAETHEKHRPHLAQATNDLRAAIANSELHNKIRLNWW